MFGMKLPDQSISPDSMAASELSLPLNDRNRSVLTFGRPGW